MKNFTEDLYKKYNQNIAIEKIIIKKNSLYQKILIFDSKQESRSRYMLALGSLGHIIKVTHTEDEFFMLCNELVPDIIILNDTLHEIETLGLLKAVRTDSLLEHVSVLFLVKKLGHTSAHRARELRVYIEEYPINNSDLLQMVKKMGNKSVLPVVETKENNELLISTYIELIEFNLLGFSFLSPMKLQQKYTVQIDSDLLNKIGHAQSEYLVEAQGQNHESNVYLNKVLFKGISSSVLKRMKSYRDEK